MNRARLQQFAERYPCATIKRSDGPPYMHRYFLYRGDTYAAFLHHIVASDPDGQLHNHPWKKSWSLILAGNYLEERLVDRATMETSYRYFRPGQINRIGGDTFHRLTLPVHEAPSVWTLFIHGKRTKNWGFLDYDGRYVPYIGPRTDTLAVAVNAK